MCKTKTVTSFVLERTIRSLMIAIAASLAHSNRVFDVFDVDDDDDDVDVDGEGSDSLTTLVSATTLAVMVAFASRIKTTASLGMTSVLVDPWNKNAKLGSIVEYGYSCLLIRLILL